MPWYEFICETCEQPARKNRSNKQAPPRFCCRVCTTKGLSGQSLKPVKHVITPFIHERIKRCYANSTGHGEVAELAKRLNIPRTRITRYACEQGWIAVQKKEPDWSERELRILEQSAHCCPTVIRKHLKAAGFIRSTVGIALKRKRMRFLSNLKGQAATSLALCFGIDVKTITRWIEKGYLKAKRRGTERTEKQGGDMWFIKDQHIKDFVKTYPEFVDFRKVDKIWLIDLLAGSSGGISDSEGQGYEAAQY